LSSSLVAPSTNKKPQPEAGSFSLPRSAALLVGPSLDLTPSLARQRHLALFFQVLCQTGAETDFTACSMGCGVIGDCGESLG